MEKKTPKKRKKNQLPSGNYRVQVYDYTDVDGKKHYKSFTAPSKKLAKLAAAEWEANKGQQICTPENLTVCEAVGRYMDIKSGVLSPSTMRGYAAMKKHYFSGTLGRLQLADVRSQDVQLWISDLAVHLSPKTVKNAYGLLSAALDMFAPELHIKVTLPQKQKPSLYCPNDQDVHLLLEHIKGTELELAVLLAAFGPLRRGEISALTDKDLSGNCIIVRHSMVRSPDNEWIIKPPKTTDSARSIELPAFVIEKLKKRKGNLVPLNPDCISNRFRRTLSQLDIPRFRFHDLRHYSASIMHSIGVPDQYILQRGGWTTDGVMKSVYRNVIDLEAAKQNKKINRHFEEVSHEVSHGAK